MEPLIQKTEQFIREKALLADGDHIIAGISGGVDSVCLLDVLDALKEKYHWELTAVHVHHGIRGMSADEDEAFVRDLCARKQIACHVHHVDVPARATRDRQSEEEAGRYARREILEKELADVCSDGGRGRIALAHHADDNAETFVMNICRGSGLEGLGGMRAFDGHAYVRPLLWASRRQIEEYAAQRRLPFREDESNADPSYTRNAVRLNVLPLLERAVNTRAQAHINAAMEELQQAEHFVSSQAQKACAHWTREEAGVIVINKEMAAKEDPYLMRRIIRLCLIKSAGAAKDIGRAHIEAVAALLRGQTGSAVDLPYGLQAVSGYGEVSIRHRREKAPGHRGEFRAAEKRMYRVVDLDPGKQIAHVRSEGSDSGQEEKILSLKNDDLYTKYFDYGIIGEQSVFRTRQDGDYIVIDQEGHRQKVGDYMTDHKILLRERDSVLLLADGHHVYWIVGCRQASDCLVTAQTQHIVEWRVNPDGF